MALAVMLLGDRGHAGRGLAGPEHDQPSARRRRRQVRHEARLRMSRRDRGIEHPAQRPALFLEGGGGHAALLLPRGRATQMPNRISAPPSAWISVRRSPRSIQPNAAAAIASRKITSEEKTGGSRPSATESSPCPPAWLTQASARSATRPLRVFGTKRA